MFIQLSTHKPKPEYEEKVIDSMHRFGAAIKDKPGLIQVHTLKDQSQGVLVGLAIWDSQESMYAAAPAMIEATKDDDFDLWESEEMGGYRLIEV